jgi:hypothetical protein
VVEEKLDLITLQEKSKGVPLQSGRPSEWLEGNANVHEEAPEQSIY